MIDCIELLRQRLADPGLDEFGPNDVVDMTFWALAEKKNPTSWRLLYGWVLRSTNATKQAWGGHYGPDVRGARLRRLTCTVTFDTAVLLLEALLSGNNLSAASAICKLDEPSKAGALALTRVGDVMLYDVSPVLFLETLRSKTSRLGVTPMKSPNATAPAFSVSLFLTQKAHLWTLESANDDLTNSAFSADVARAAVKWLEEETGLRFSSDATRLGNVEFLAFPSAEQERPLVKLEPSWLGERVGEPDHFRVSIKNESQGDSEEHLVRCQQFAGSQVIRDECQILPHGTWETLFECDQAVGSCALEVWRKQRNTTAFQLWFADEYQWISRVEMHMGVMGLKGREESDLLSAISSPRLKTRVSKFMTVAQVHSEKIIAGQGPSSWEKVTREGRQLASTLFPPVSGARFFDKGWHREGRLSFLEWLRDVVGTQRQGSVLFVDPYFDSVGVDVFSGMSQTQLSYIVVTSTDVPSTDDKHSTSTRAARIRNQCERKAVVLRNLDLRICDIRSPKDHPLHDRYLLLFDAEGIVSKGFHLSNSIQQATKNHPLLVTPIPVDVLEDVAGYARSVLQVDPRLVGEVKLEILYERPPRRAVLEPVVKVPWHPEVVALLLLEVLPSQLEPAPSSEKVSARVAAIRAQGHYENDEALRLEAELLVALEGKGITVERASDLRTVFENKGLSHDGSRALCRRLQEVQPEEFHPRWASWADICANLPDAKGTKLREEAVGSCDDRLFDALEAEVRRALEWPAPGGLLGRPIPASIDTLAHYFSWSFEKFLSHAKYFLWQYPIRVNLPNSWGLRAAISALKERPQVLVRLATEIHDEAERDPSPPFIILFAMITEEICEALSWSRGSKTLEPPWEIIEPLLTSRCAFLRGLGAVTAVESCPLEDALKYLDKLDHEAVYVLAERVGDIRVSANQAGNAESGELRRSRLEVSNAIVERWPNSITPEFLSDIFRRVSGPNEGSWAMSTVNDLFTPLCDRGTLDAPSVVSLMVDLVVMRIESTLGLKTRGYQFYADTDAELTEVSAQLLTRADEAKQDETVEAVDKLMRKARQFLTRPFAASANYRSWSSGRDGLRWGATFLALYLHHGASEGERAGPVRSIVDKAWGLLDLHVQEPADNDVTGLGRWTDEVRRVVEVN